MIAKEPVLTASSVLALVGGLLGYLTSSGVLSATQASTLTQVCSTVVPFVLPLVAGWVARSKVTPVVQAPPNASKE